MAQGKKLQKIKFYAISRDIRDGRRSKQEMADFHGVSLETIRTVRKAKTWAGFEAFKKQKAAKSLQRKVALGKSRAAASRTIQGVLPINNPQGKPSIVPRETSDAQYKDVQDQLDELKKELDEVRSRLGGHDRLFRRLSDWVQKLDDQTIKRWWRKG